MIVEWSGGVVAAVAAIAVVLGYGIAAFVFKRKERLYVLQQHEKALTLSRQQEQLLALQQQVQRWQDDFDVQRDEAQSWRQQWQALQQQYQQVLSSESTLKATLAEKEKHFQAQIEQLELAKSTLRQEFENLANKIFEEKNQRFHQASQMNLDQLLKPFREQIEGFQKRLNEVHDASLQGQTHLYAEIRKILDVGLQMSTEANHKGKMK